MIISKIKEWHHNRRQRHLEKSLKRVENYLQSIYLLPQDDKLQKGARFIISIRCYHPEYIDLASILLAIAVYGEESLKNKDEQ